MIRIRMLRREEAAESARLHHDVLGMEFLSRFGPGFLAAYHRAWIASPSGLALAAVDSEDRLLGVVLASLDPASHYRRMLFRGGPGLALRLAAGSLRQPVLARDLAATRAVRYARAAWRQLTPPPPLAAPTPAGARSGEVTHLMVRPEARGKGAATGLLSAVEGRAVAAGVREIVLVTPPSLDARHFYDHLGWEATGLVISRSGEHFIRFIHRLEVHGRGGGSATPAGFECPDRRGGLEALDRVDGC